MRHVTLLPIVGGLILGFLLFLFAGELHGFLRFVLDLFVYEFATVVGLLLVLTFMQGEETPQRPTVPPAPPQGGRVHSP